jgi:transposase
MADIRRIPDLYELYGSYKKVARELSISPNILQEPRVGQRAEFDWGEVHLQIRGISSKFYQAVFVLPFSLYRFARLYPRSTRLEVIQAHIEFFHEGDRMAQYVPHRD